MSSNVRLIKIKEQILSDNKGLADKLRHRLREHKTFLLNVMSAPGSGKTSLILNTIERLRDSFRIAVVEADLDSTVDADKIAAVGIPAVQLETGGFCHVDAAMVERALESVDLETTDLVILENVGNLVCPAQSDTGASASVVILSVPEGDDKPQKYPIMFTVADALVVNKTDFMAITEFDMDALRRRVGVLNRGMPVFEVSCTTKAGVEAWTSWLSERIAAFGEAD